MRLKDSSTKTAVSYQPQPHPCCLVCDYQMPQSGVVCRGFTRRDDKLPQKVMAAEGLGIRLERQEFINGHQVAAKGIEPLSGGLPDNAHELSLIHI